MFQRFDKTRQNKVLSLNFDIGRQCKLPSMQHKKVTCYCLKTPSAKNMCTDTQTQN